MPDFGMSSAVFLFSLILQGIGNPQKSSVDVCADANAEGQTTCELAGQITCAAVKRECDNLVNKHFYYTRASRRRSRRPSLPGTERTTEEDACCKRFTNWADFVDVDADVDSDTGTNSNLVRQSLFPAVIPPFIHFAPFLSQRRRRQRHGYGHGNSSGETAAQRHKELELVSTLNWVRGVPLVTRLVKNMGFQVVKEDADVGWTGFYTWRVGPARENKKVVWAEHQKYNLIPGGELLCHKDKMWVNAKKFISKFGGNTMPFLLETYTWPSHRTPFSSTPGCHAARPEEWIFKPSRAARRRGQFVFTSSQEFRANLAAAHAKSQGQPQWRSAVIQKYVRNSYKIRGGDVRLRAFFLVTSVHPLRLYVYKLLEPLIQNLERPVREPSVVMLTSDFMQQIDQDAALKTNSTTMFDQIKDAGIKLVLSVLPKLAARGQAEMRSRYNGFQVWSADFIIEAGTGALFLLEMNRYASLEVMYKNEALIRIRLLVDTLNLAGYHFPPGLDPEGVQILQKLADNSGSGSGPLTFKSGLYEHLSRKAKPKARNWTSPSPLLERLRLRLDCAELKELLLAEDELARAATGAYERIFPRRDTGAYLKYVQPEFSESDRRVYSLQAEWERRFGGTGTAGDRTEAHRVLNRLVEANMHCFRVVESK